MNISRLRILFVGNWIEEGKWPLYRAAANRTSEAHYFCAIPMKGSLRKLSILLSEFYLPVAALIKKDKYDVIASWTMRMGIVYGIMNRLFGSPSSPKHIIHDFHINLIRKDFFYGLRHMLLRFALPGIDFFLCTSTREEEIYSKMFGISRERIRFYPMAAPSDCLCNYQFEPKDYIFSYGNSDRDYDTLIKAVADSDIKLVILSQSYSPQSPLPPNVTLITEGRYGMDLIALIVPARLIVLPTNYMMVSAAQSAMLESLALGRPLVVSANLATVEYADHLKTAVFFKPGDAAALAESIRFLLDNPAFAEAMGQRAREAARGLTPRHQETFFEVMDTVAGQP
ncbi:MAG: glycosyltransferase [Syntrophobacteraceae bacterium]|jgi:glycosyltransferase involved in cell wall biosynthesis